MTKNKDILKPFEVIERQTLEVENVVEKNKYFTILFFSQLYTQLDTCQNFHPYADDLVVFAPSISGLRELLKVCDVFADSHDIKYNPNKSQVLISRGKFLSGVTIPPFCIGGSCIPETGTVKYLGHFICNTMRDDTDILRRRRQLYARANVLARKFYMCADEVNITLFRTFCCNLCTCQSYAYGPTSIWGWQTEFCPNGFSGGGGW